MATTDPARGETEPGAEPAGAVRPASSTHGFLPGDELCDGRFRIVRFVAKGGMGEVYEADDEILRERVALKAVRPDLMDKSTILARFAQEIRLARQVSHPSICRVHDTFQTTFQSGEAGGQRKQVFLLTMEFLEGETIARRLTRTGPFPVAQAVSFILQMCDGLAVAHARGIVHRDLKPANVVLMPPRRDEAGERAVITDFGLALNIEQPQADRLTLFGSRLGTPAYMAPEQLVGGAVSTSTDIYALALVLLEMLTARRFFDSDSLEVAVEQRSLEGPPPIAQQVPDLDPRLLPVLSRCLEPVSERRYRTARELHDALAQIDASVSPPTVAPPAVAPQPAPPAPPRSAVPIARTARIRIDRRYYFAAGGVAALAAFVLLGWLLAGSRGPADRPSVAAPRGPLPPGLEVEGGKVSVDPRRTQALRALALGDGYRAHEILVAAIKLDPRSPHLRLAASDAAAFVGDETSALLSARAALELGREDPAIRGGAEARIDVLNGNHARAEAGFRALWKANLGDVELGLALARIERRRARFEEARAVLDELRGKTPDASRDPRVDIAGCYVEVDASKPATGQRVARQALKHAQEQKAPFLVAQSQTCLGMALLSEGKHEEAKASLRQAYAFLGEKSGGNLRLQTLLGLIRLAEAQRDRALARRYLTAFTRDANALRTREWKEKLQELRRSVETLEKRGGPGRDDLADD